MAIQVQKYEEFLKEIDVDLPIEIRNWIFTAKLAVNDYMFMAAFVYQNQNYFDIDDFVNLLRHCNPHMNEEAKRSIYEHFEGLNEPDLHYRWKICVFDIESNSVLNLQKEKPRELLLWYPQYIYPELDHDNDVIDSGGGWVVYACQ